MRVIWALILIFWVPLAGCADSTVHPTSTVTPDYALEFRDLVRIADLVFDVDVPFCEEKDEGPSSFGHLQQFPDDSPDVRDLLGPHVPCLELPPPLRTKRNPYEKTTQYTHDSGKLMALDEARKDPLRYFATLDDYEERVKTSVVLRDKDQLTLDRWNGAVEFVEPTFDLMRGVIDPVLGSKLKLVVNGDEKAPFLDAKSFTEGDEIVVSPGLFRAFFSACASYLDRAVQFDRAAGLCPWRDWRNCEGFLLMSCQQKQADEFTKSREIQQACSRAGSMRPQAFRSLTEGGGKCVAEASAFVLAHEIAHKVLDDPGNDLGRELEADDCGRLIMEAVGLDIKIEAYRAFVAISNNPDLFGVVDSEKRQWAEERRKKLQQPITDAVRAKCKLTKSLLPPQN